MKICSKHPDKKSVARGMCNSCYQGWRRKNTVTGKVANRRNKILEVKRRKKKNQEWVRVIKETTPCTDCKNLYPFWVMQFDHINDDKKFSISGSLSRTTQTLEAEISKCEVVCALCHAHRTYCRLMKIEHYILVSQKDCNNEKTTVSSN